jgi:hypothetical protein
MRPCSRNRSGRWSFGGQGNVDLACAAGFRRPDAEIAGSADRMQGESPAVHDGNQRIDAQCRAGVLDSGGRTAKSRAAGQRADQQQRREPDPGPTASRADGSLHVRIVVVNWFLCNILMPFPWKKAPVAEP